MFCWSMVFTYSLIAVLTTLVTTLTEKIHHPVTECLNPSPFKHIIAPQSVVA